MAQDAGAYDAIASAVLATLDVGAARASAGAWVPELARVLSQG
jgi:hypothetical protein